MHKQTSINLDLIFSKVGEQIISSRDCVSLPSQFQVPHNFAVESHGCSDDREYSDTGTRAMMAVPGLSSFFPTSSGTAMLLPRPALVHVIVSSSCPAPTSIRTPDNACLASQASNHPSMAVLQTRSPPRWPANPPRRLPAVSSQTYGRSWNTSQKDRQRDC